MEDETKHGIVTIFCALLRHRIDSCMDSDITYFERNKDICYKTVFLMVGIGATTKTTTTKAVKTKTTTSKTNPTKTSKK